MIPAQENGSCLQSVVKKMRRKSVRDVLELVLSS